MYKNYKKDYKRNIKEFQLKLDKNQYLNFKFKVTNPTFPALETDFILYDWFTSYCNSIYRSKEQRAPITTKEKNVQSPSRLKYRTDNITVNKVIDYSKNTSEANASTITSETNALTTSNIPVITEAIIQEVEKESRKQQKLLQKLLYKRTRETGRLINN
ncbi:unnamed protein product [Rhizophagus irregularis]|nr:unnamed protein product [Rhizophagus irregularis]